MHLGRAARTHQSEPAQSGAPRRPGLRCRDVNDARRAIRLPLDGDQHRPVGSAAFAFMPAWTPTT